MATICKTIARSRVLLTLLILAIAPASLIAQATRTWTGGGGDNNWTTAANWGGTAPVAGDHLIFDATGVSARPSPNNDFTGGTTFGSIQLLSSGYTIAGNGLIITSAVSVDYASGSSTISLVIGGAQVDKWSAGALVLSGGNTFTGGLTVGGGTVTGTTSASAFGAGNIVLGQESTSPASATLLVGTTGLTITRPIQLSAETSGTLTVGTSGSAVSTTFSGGVTGSNSLTIANNGGSVTFSTSSVNNAGTITSTGSSFGTTTISAAVGSNVTGIVQNSTTTASLWVSGAISVNSGGTTITNSAGSITVSGGIVGAGNLVLQNNGTCCGNTLAITTGAVNHIGTITNSGSGSGSTSITAVIGTNVTGVTQNSANSPLTLSGANTFTSGLTILAGTVTGSSNSNTFGAGGSITLGNTSGSESASLFTTSSGLTIARPIVLATGVTGTLSVGTSAGGGSTATFSGGVTGANDLTLVNNTGSGTLTFSTLSVNNAGNITNTGSSSGATTISAAVGSNITGITLSSTTSALNVNGALTVNSGGTILTNTSGTKLLTVQGGITGTGNLILNNSSSTDFGVQIGGSVNNVGTVTNQGSGSGLSSISAVIGTNVDGVIQNSSTSSLMLWGSNTFSTGLTVREGTVTGVSSANAFGAGTIRIGHTTGSADASVLVATSGLTIARPIVVESGTSGTLSVGTSGTAISASFSGGITGSNNLTLANNGTTGTLSFVTGGINAAGTITAAGGGTGGISISGNVGSNVTGLIQNSTTSALTVSGALSVNSGGTALTNSSGTKVLTLSGGVSGTGNLVLNNNSSTADAIVLSSTAVNHAGSITNAGSGTGSTSISSAIGSNVTGVIQNSPTSSLSVTGAITVHSSSTTLANSSTSGTAGLNIRGGTTGAGDLVLENNTAFNVVVLSTTAINHTGAVLNSGTGSGRVRIAVDIGSNVTGVVQNSSSSQLNLAGNNAFSGLTIRAGSVFGESSANAFGSGGSITLGHTSGSANASLLVGSSLSFNQPIVLASTTAGTLTVGTSGTGISAAFTGGVTGSNNLTIASDGGPGAITFAATSVNNSGTITNTGSGTGATSINAGVGSNVTGIILNSETTSLNVTGAITVNSSGTTIANSSSSGTTILNITGGTTGAGNLVLDNNTSTTDGIMVSTTALNHIGTVMNSGTGSGRAGINAVIGSNVTGVVQNSSTSQLMLAGNNTFSGLTIRAGTVLGSNFANAFGSGGSITLGHTTGSANASLLVGWSGLTFNRPIVLASSTTGALTVGTSGTGISTTFTGGVTGANNLIIGSNGTTGTIVFSTTSLNNAGTVTNTGGGAGSTTISAAIGPNVTEIVAGSATSGLRVTGALTVNNAGTTLTNATTSGSITLELTGGVSGTGNLVLKNNRAIFPGVRLSSSPVNNSGTITNAGTDGRATIDAAIGSNVTGVAQNSATSILELSSANTYAGPTTISAGQLYAYSSDGLGNGASTNTLILSGGTLVALGTISSPSTRPVSLSGASTINTFEESVTIAGPVAGSGSLTKDGDGGTLTFSGDASVDGNLTISAGTVAGAAGKTVSVAGNWTNNASFTSGGGTVRFFGASPQTIDGSSATTFDDLHLDGVGGLAITTSPTVNGTLTFTAGRISTGANKVTIGAAGSVTGAGAGTYVFGNLERIVPNAANPSLAFAVGDATIYAPVTIAFAGTTTGSGSLTVTTTTGDHPSLATSGLNPSKGVNRYWTVTNNGVGGFTSYDGTFTFDAADVDTDATTANFVARRNDGVSWSIPVTGTVTPTSAQATGLTTFSDFAFGELWLAGAVIASTTPAAFTEVALNGATVVIDLTDATFNAALATTDFALTSAPAGTTISGVTRTTDTRATLTLAFDGTDFDAASSVSVQVGQSALADAAGPAGAPAISVAPSAATSVTIAGPATGVANGVSGALTLTSHEANGTTMTVETDRAFTLASSTPATATFFSDAGGTSAITQATIPNGSSTASFHYRDAAAGAKTITATNDALGAATVEHTVASSSFTIASSPAALSETNLNGAMVTIDLGSASYAAALAATNFALATAPPGATIASVSRTSDTRAVLTLAFDGTDFDAVSAISVAVQQSALATGAAATTAALPVSAAPASSVTIAGPASVAQRAVSDPIVLAAKESNGTSMALATDAAFTLSSSSTGAASFWSGSGGTGTLTSLPIPAGASSAAFYYQDDTYGARTITASNATLGDATLGLDVARQTYLAFEPFADSVAVDLPIAPAVVVRALDAAGQIDTTFADTVILVLADKPDGAGISGTLQVPAIKGIASFADVRVDAVGSGYTLSASAASGALPPVTSTPLRAFLAPVDLAATITASNQQPAVGDTIEVTINVANHSDARAFNVSYNVPLPDRAQFVSAEPAAGTYDSSTGVWTIGTIGNNATASLVITIVVKALTP